MRNKTYRNSAGLIGGGLILSILMMAAGARAQYVNTVISSNLFEPNSVTIDPQNNVYVTDSSDNRILKFVPTSGAVSTLAGKSGPQFAGHVNAIGAAARFSQPLGIVYANGGLVVADSANQVLRFVTLNGVVSDYAGVDANHGLGGFVDGPAATAQFAFPTGIASDPAGNLYIADTGNNAIRRLSGGVVNTIQVNNYKFGNPTAVAVDLANNLWIADTRNDVICVISNISQISNQTVTVIAGTPGVAGTNDSLVANEAQFNYPSGILAVTNDNSILISDTGNHTLRRLYVSSALGSPAFAVSTVAGIPGVSGNVNGSLGVAEFASPVGLSFDLFDEGFYVVDRANESLRVLQTTTPQPPVETPELGYITANTVSGTVVSVFNALVNGGTYVFNNAQIMAIVADPASQTYLTNVTTSSDPFNQVSPVPGPGWETATVYNNQNDVFPPPPGQVYGFPLSGMPTNDTIYLYSSAPGRASSIVVSNQLQFITATPTILGNNGANVIVTDATTNPAVLMYYTLDGSTPTTSSFGPVTNGETLPIINSNAVLSVFAVAPGFAPSGSVSAQLETSNFVGNEMTLGFAAGEASSAFIASAGQHFYAPVTMSLLPGTTMYSLQMNLFATNFPGSPPINSNSLRFDSFLMQFVTIAGTQVLVPIEPAIVPLFNNGTFTNTGENLLGVGWVERYPATNLYNTTKQDLIKYSQAHDITFTEDGGQIEVGSFSFLVPSNAANGQTYSLAVGSPSGVTYFPPGRQDPVAVFISSVTNGSLTRGPMNSIKTVTVGSAQYLVGDAFPFRWFNAGDFGDGFLLNDDVVEVFQSAIYGYNTPPNTSDYFNTMDSSDGSDNNLYDGNDTAINNIKFGDGILAVDDVYVTFRRSLDPSLTNYVRYWSNGVLTARAVPTTAFIPQPQTPATPKTPHPKADITPQSITVSADQVQASGSSTIQVPIRITSSSSYPARVLMFNVDVVPLDGSPALSNNVNFVPNGAIGLPMYTSSKSPGNYGAAWLDSTVAGITGSGVVGMLNITLPPEATANSSYQIHFEHFSASPNGVALFHTTLQDGLVTGSDRSASSWGDGIPDSWRLLYFGSVSNALSAAALDPDGDGASNWQEFIAGTNPNDATSVFQITASTLNDTGFTLQWPSVPDKTYTVESSPTLGPANWSVIATNLVGNGQPMQWSDTNSSTANFYQVQVH
jgi:hypothetical protein